MRNPLRDLPLETAGPAPFAAVAVGVLLQDTARSTTEMLALAAELDLPAIGWVAIPALEGSWYPRGLMAEVEDNQPYLDHAIDRIDEVLADLERQGVPPERVALLGVSQGACLAAQYVFLNPRRYGALIAFTGGLIGPPGSAWGRGADLAGTPVLLTTAEGDQRVPLERVLETSEVLSRMNARVELRVRPGAEHGVDAAELAAARAILVTLR